MIDLDHNATTLLDPLALEAMAKVARDAGGNPGSRHRAGRRARQALEDARESIAEIVDCDPRDLIFTSGGTESNNLALLGMAAGRCGKILLPRGEHPATEEPVRRLIANGWTRQELPINETGRLVESALTDPAAYEGVLIATALLAHNETGVIQDLAPLSEQCLQRGIGFHIDAVQAVGKIDVSFRNLQATSLSFGAHKFHGPRGIGGLILRSNVNLQSQQLGGHQEAGRRAGTEPVMLAVGMNVALRSWHQNQSERTARLNHLRNRLESGLLASCSPAVVNGTTEYRLPNTTNISFPGCEGDSLLIALDLAGICCSLGSACASGSIEPSPILVAMGLPRERYSSAVRFSVGDDNTLEEIEQAVQLIAKAVTRLRMN